MTDPDERHEAATQGHPVNRKIVRTVAVIDDDDDEEFFFRRSLRKAGITVEVIRLNGGQDAINYFSRTGRYVDSTLYPAADLAFLDVKMPGISGFEVLDWLRRNPEIPRPFVTMLSSSDLQGDKQRARDLGADEYLVKPASAAVLERFAKRHGMEWPLGPNEGSKG